MEIQLISIPDSADNTVSVALGGDTYYLDFKFISAIQRYTLDIYKPADNLLIAGLVLIEGVPLNAKHYIPEIGNGGFILSKMSNTTETAGRNNVGIDKDFTLAYFYGGE